MRHENSYQQLVDAYYQAVINPDDDTLLGIAIKLSANFNHETVEDAKREASVMSVMDSQFQA